MKNLLVASLSTLLIAIGTAGVEATPYTLDFEISPTRGSSAENSGDWTFAGGVGTTLSGSGIEVDGLNIVEAPLSSGTTGSIFTVLNGSLDFTTGGLESIMSAGTLDTLTFGAGGSISLTGTVDADGSGDVSAGDYGATLLTGTFETMTVIVVGHATAVSVATFSNATNDGLEAHVGLSDVTWQGTFNISLQLDYDPGGDPYAFDSSRTLSGDIVNTVPEPVTGLLLGAGTLGFGLLARRRRRIALRDDLTT